MVRQFWTIGHSTRPIDDFAMLLQAHGIQELVDVRTMPRSRYNPQFNTEPLTASLRSAGIHYRHMPTLGGLRKPIKDSINQGWRNDSFRGYADYMQTEEFHRALEELMSYGTDTRAAVMCAEAVPWRCHRSLIADALLTHNWEVRHITGQAEAKLHQLTSFAFVGDGALTYPTPIEPPSTLRLF